MASSTLPAESGNMSRVRQGEKRILRQPEIKLPQIVETNLRLGQSPKASSNFGVVTEIAQHTVTDASVGDLVELLFDRHQRLAWPFSACQVEQHWEERSEPAHGAREVYTGQDLLSAVALQVHEQPTAAGPSRERLRQGSQQHVVDLGVISMRHFLQQGASIVSAEYS